MAKTRSRNRHQDNYIDSDRIVGREFQTFARRSLPLLSLVDVQDRRLFNPSAVDRPQKKVRGTAARVVVRTPGAKTVAPGVSLSALAFTPVVPWGLEFQDAERVVVCVRRRRRREVLHARGVAGSKGLRPPRYNFWSKISCRG